LDGKRFQPLGPIIVPSTRRILALAIGGIRVHQQVMRRMVTQRDERAVRAAASAFSRQLRHQKAPIHAISLRLSDRVPPDVLLEQSSFLADDFNLGLAVLDSDGALVASTVPADVWSNIDPGAFITSLNGQEAAFTSPRFYPGEKPPGPWPPIALRCPPCATSSPGRHERAISDKKDPKFLSRRTY
jgi:hypothetical protein